MAESTLTGSTPQLNWEAGDLPKAWKSFRTHVEFMFNGPLKSKSEEEKCNYLMIRVEDKGREIYGTWTLTNDEKKSLDTLYAKFKAYVEPKSNRVFSRYKFQCIVQSDTDSCEQFITALKIAVKDCGYDNPDEMVRDRIVFGIKSPKIREKLINEGSGLALEKAIDVARSYEMSQAQLKSMSLEDPKIDAINKHKFYNRNKPNFSGNKMRGGQRQHANKTSNDSKPKCGRCGSSDHNKDEECPAIGKICRKCNRFDHYESMCHRIDFEGTIRLPVSHKGVEHYEIFYIVNLDAPNVVGAETCKKLNLVQRIHAIKSDTCSTEPVLQSLSDIYPDSDYSDLFQGLGCLPGKYSIKLGPNVTPVIHPPRKIPISLMDKVRNELKSMEEKGVIVKQTEPTEWVNSMVIVNKGNKIRICIDPKDLNHAIMKEHFPLKTIEDIIGNMPNAKVFSILDATTGFWQIQLDEASSKLCAFNTSFGRFRFTRLPFGIKSASEVFQKVTSQMVEDIPGAEAIIDDILIWGSTKQEHDERLKRVLDKAREYNLKLSPDKCKLRRDSIKYVGHILSSEGVKPDPEKIRAVQSMEKPTNKQEMLTFLGFVQYLGKFMPRMSDVSTLLRKLTEHSAEWIWTREHDVSFDTLKTMATNAPVLKYYDPNLPLTLSVDATSKGVGAVLIQEGKPIAYGSRALTDSQKNYAQIEKETLALVYGCQKFHQYIFGRTVHVETDHKPLQSIFSKSLLKAPMRLQRLLLAVQKYDLVVKYKPGKLVFLADHLSRSFLPETTEQLIPDVEVNSISPASYLPLSQDRYLELQQKTGEDETLQTLKNTVQNGWPMNKSQLPYCLHPYWSIRDEIAFIDGLLYKGDRLIIPKSLQPEMLNIIHQSHLGIVKCKSRAREVLYWPGMSSQIEDKISQCSVCAEIQNSNPKEPLLTVEIPDRPWAKIATDIFVLNSNHYLLTVDYYSKWPEVVKLNELTSSYVIAALKSQFAKYGIPDEIISDNGPQYSSREFQEFANCYGFTHNTSSPHYAQSNGQAERMIQTVKRLLKKSSDPYLSLMDYRNTPLENIGYSPAQLFLGRRIKTMLPTTSDLLRTPNSKLIQEKLRNRQAKAKHHFDRKAGKPLSQLKVGDSVMIQNHASPTTWKHGTVDSKHHAERSYIIRTPDNKCYRRNRKMLKPTQSTPPLSHDVTVEKSFANPDSVSSIPKVAKSTSQPSTTNGSANLQSSIPNTLNSNLQQTRSGRIVRKPAKYADFVS
ncbi:hypothetical protein FSP39_014641 [Pinctada imbricata]|uniref:Transposon Ty3-G Gag-Pol poly n=1 Tax=Pinctada imbricata TaxID=66713 RepID=A0AA88YKK9_PINIB|nr:hypothetical protein FSP39_014641 [Pinctada imbricata]